MHLAEMPLYVRKSFSSSYSLFCSAESFPDDNLRTPQPIVFKLLSVINYGHKKIPKPFKWVGVFVPPLKDTQTLNASELCRATPHTF